MMIPAFLLLSCHPRVATMPDSCCPGHPVTAAPDEPAVASNSIYQLDGRWTDENNRLVALQSLKGRVQLVAMIYTYCGYTCPRIIADMKAIRNNLPAGVRDQVGCVLVTLDPERDTPAQLREFAREQGLDSHWELLRGSAAQVRELSMVLNIQYANAGNGNISHSAGITVLDREGRIVRSLQGTGVAGTEVVAEVGRIAVP